jgi:hypothetical protein
MGAIIAEVAVKSLERIRNEPGLPAPFRGRGAPYHFLQGNNIGIEPPQCVRNPVRLDPTIKPATLVYVVGKDTDTSVHLLL